MINDLTKAGGAILGIGFGLIALYLAMPQVTSLLGMSLLIMGGGLALMATGIIFGFCVKLLGGNI